MARLIPFMAQIPNIINEIYEQNRLADRYRHIEFNAAVKIQSWYRGLRLRTYIKYLNKSATIIQKAWRGYLGRKKYRKFLEERVLASQFNFYNEKAVIIQKYWRSYYSRKYKFDYYKRKHYLQTVQQQNEIVLKSLNDYKEYMEREREEKKLMDKYKRMEDEAKRNHYLISTKTIPGVYNSPYYPTPNEKEYLMRSVTLDAPKKTELYQKSHFVNNFSSITLPEGLPPLPVKPQGPFRDPLDVRKQRYRPFSPSLKVETDFQSLEIGRKDMKNKEWTERLHDNVFHPIHKSMKNKPYEKLLSTQAQFGALDYGTKFFREEPKEKELPGGRFKTLVPAIPEFGKLNKTFVEPHYYLA